MPDTMLCMPSGRLLRRPLAGFCAGVDRSFFDEIGVTNLSIHLIDIEEVQSEIGLIGLPTTLLLDREGREVSRLIGPAEWDSPERIASVRGELGLSAPSRTQINQEGDQE